MGGRTERGGNLSEDCFAPTGLDGCGAFADTGRCPGLVCCAFQGFLGVGVLCGFAALREAGRAKREDLALCGSA